MRSSLIFCVLSILTFSTTIAQRETDEKAYLNFSDGVGFLAPDSLFGMNLRFRMQNRIGLTFDDEFDNHEFEAVVRRLRLRFDGFIKDSKLTYYVQLSFSRSDQDWDVSNVPNVIRDAMVYYKFSKHFYIGFGQGKLPGNRQRVVSSGSLQFADRSIVNSQFTLDRDFGLFGYYQNAFSNSFHYQLKGAVSSGEGRNAPKSDQGLAYTARVELLPLGAFANKGDYFEGDLEHESSPKISVAATYSLNRKASKTLGQRGEALYEQRDIESFFLDILCKYNGWSLYSEYAVRNVENPITHLDNNTFNYIFTGSGINTQASYIFKNDWEVAIRHSNIEPDNKMFTLNTYKKNIYTLGFTKYISDHKAKIQLNMSYLIDKHMLLKQEKQNWNCMLQVEIGI